MCACILFLRSTESTIGSAKYSLQVWLVTPSDAHGVAKARQRAVISLSGLVCSSPLIISGNARRGFLFGVFCLNFVAIMYRAPGSLVCVAVSSCWPGSLTCQHNLSYADTVFSGL